VVQAVHTTEMIRVAIKILSRAKLRKVLYARPLGVWLSVEICYARKEVRASPSLPFAWSLA
jgi:hypothetical protein